MTAATPVVAPTRGVLADLLVRSRVLDVVLVGLYAMAIGLSAQLIVPLPFTPVPITGQTFAVLVGGVALGPWRAVAGGLVYALAGLAGVPWLAGGEGGLAAATSPSFGYVIGFVAAGWLVGRLAESRWDRSFARMVVVMVAGSLLIYVFGAGWLAVALRVSAAEAVRLGVLPFLIGDAVKVLLGTAVVPAVWRLVRRDR